ncbi:MAG: hypothetical protein WCL44_02665 [bacterium]
MPHGFAVYQHEGEILLKSLDTNSPPVRIAQSGSFPRFSPDGTQVAFVGSNRIMLANCDGTGLRALADARKGKAVAFHPNGNEVLFTDGEYIKAVTISNGSVRIVASGYRFQGMDVSPDGSLLVTTVRSMGVSIRLFDLVNGGSRSLMTGCSASFSPDGELVTCNQNDHSRLNIIQHSTGKNVGSVSAPAGMKFDNQFWSNDPDWLVSVSEGPAQDIFIHHAASNLYFRVTGTGNCDRPDLFIAKGTRP